MKLHLKRLLRRLGWERAPRTLSSVDAYARWASSYPPHAHNALMQAEQAAMLALMPALAGRRVLDLASGTGRYGLLARERGAAAVYALDNSPPMLARNPLAHKALATSDALPLAGGAVDVVLCGMAVGHVPRLADALREISRVLVGGGFALVSDFHPMLYLNGARRTFSAGGETYAVEHYVHQDADWRRACVVAGLEINAVLEPRLAEAGDRPVALVLRLRKQATPAVSAGDG